MKLYITFFVRKTKSKNKKRGLLLGDGKKASHDTLEKQKLRRNIIIPSITQNTRYKYSLVGGFNPFEKYSSKWVHPPQIRVKIKHIWNHQPVIFSETNIYPQNHEKWRFYTPQIWVITPKNEGCGFPWSVFAFAWGHVLATQPRFWGIGQRNHFPDFRPLGLFYFWTPFFGGYPPGN